MSRFTQREQLYIYLFVSALCTVAYWLVAPQPEAHDVDHRGYEVMIQAVRDGLSYYEAQSRGLTVMFGGAADSVLSWRLPTSGWLWALWPGDFWVLYLLWLTAICGLVAWLVPRPLGVLLPFMYLLLGSFPRTEFGWAAFWLYVEFWVAPLAMLTLALWWRGKDGLALVVAFAACLLREHMVLLLVGGFLGADKERRRWWATAIGAYMGIIALHWSGAARHTITDGAQPDHFGGGSLYAVLESAGFSIAGGIVLGPALLIWAATRTDRRAWPLLSLPLAGFVVRRVYWGLMALPVAMLIVTQPRQVLVRKSKNVTGQAR